MTTLPPRALLLFCLVFIHVSLFAAHPASARDEIPGSFVYGGQSSRVLLQSWAKTETSSLSPTGRQVTETTWREPGGGLAATWRVEHIAGSAALEYRWMFANHGTRPTQAITDVAALDLTLADASQTQLISSTGGLTGPFDGTPPGFVVSASGLAQPTTLSASGGRSSNRNLPFWVLHHTSANRGRFVGVGWSGQWAADFRPVAGHDSVRLTIGMPGTKIALPAGERIISPSVLLGSYQGNSQTGGNALRRILNNDYVARLGNQKLAPPVSWNSWFTFTNNISDPMLRRQADAVTGMGVEYFCIDAGWFTGGFDAGLGNWTVDPVKFPQGLAEFGTYVAQRGMKLGLWFEPGRAMPGTRLATEHPEWVANHQVKLEIPAARDWLFNAMCNSIDAGQVGWIRYDMNQGYFPPDPLTSWNARDTADTQGLTQIRYLQGEYELMDRLRAKYPGMVIESCASGGRRIDLETIRRAHTFWKSDETNNLIVARSQETGGNAFLPGGLLNTNLPGASRASTFDLHSLFAGPLGFATDWTKLDPAGRQRVTQAIADFKIVRGLINKDYYPLFPQTTDAAQWAGWEFFDPATGEGFLTVLRPETSPMPSATVRLGGVETGKRYEFSRPDGSHVRQIDGGTLLAGLVISLDAGGSEVWRFHAVRVERVGNGGFEEWAPDPGTGVWLAKGAENGGYTPARAFRTGEGERDTTRHSGKYAQYLVGDKYPQGLVAGATASPGEHYRFSAWVKVGDGGGECYAIVHAISTSSYYVLGSSRVNGPCDWRKAELTVTCPEGESGVFFHLFIGGGVYVDDLSVQRVAEGPPVPLETLQQINQKKGIVNEQPKGEMARTISRKRIAVFQEDGFPSSSVRSAEWYVQTLRDAGLAPAVIGVSKLAAPGDFSKQKFDTLLIATGGNLPLEAEANISRFLEAGGTMIADGNLFAPDELPPAFTNSQLSTKPGRMFQKDASGGWAAVRCPYWGSLFYYNQSEDFDLMLMNDGWRKLPGDAAPNPALAEFLPANLPAKIHAGKGWVVRVEPKNASYIATTPTDVTELIYNLLLPVYTFTDAASPKQGATDFFIYRYHSLRKNGATLLQFGEIGKAALATDGGGALLIAMLRLAESRLPGEFETDFYLRRNEFRTTLSEFYRAWCDASWAAKDAILVAHYRGAAQERETLISEYQALEKLLAGAVSAELHAKELDKYHDASSDATRKEWILKLRDGMARLKELSGKWRKEIDSHACVPGLVTAKQFPGEMKFYSDSSPSGIMGLRHQYEALKELGVIASVGHYTDGLPVHGPQMFKEFGIGWDHYFVGRGASKADKGPVPADSFDPKTLQASEGTSGEYGYLFTDFSNVQNTLKDFEALLDDLKSQGGLTVARWTAEHIAGGGYYGPKFDAWGPGFNPILQDHLKKKYGTIAALNQSWQTDLSGFVEAKVPLKFPETSQEHALWEEWTKLREDSYLEWLEKMTGLLRKHLPGVSISNGANVPFSDKWPACAMNYYRISKYYDIIGTHSYNTKPAGQWALFDLIDGKKPFIDDEWGGLFTSSARYDENVKVARNARWRDMSAGQVGFTFFGFCFAGTDRLQFVDWEGVPRLIGWDLKHWGDEGRRLGHLLLDGEKAAPQVGIIFSETNNRHTARPDSPTPMQSEATGFSHVCLLKQLPAHVLTEEKILDGLPVTEKVLVLPGIEYVPEELWNRIEKWVRTGGHLIATLPAATYEAYGQRHDYVLTLAGLAVVKPSKPTIQGDGWLYFSRLRESEMRGFREILPGKREILYSFASGEPAVVRAQVGKGTVTVMGMPFGRDVEDYWSEQPAVPMAIFDRLIAPSGAKPTLFSNDRHLILREWVYAGDRYVFLYHDQDEGMRPVSFDIAGAWRVEDYLLGMTVPTDRVNGRTRVNGYLQSPGGIVYRLQPAADSAGGKSSAATVTTTNVTETRTAPQRAPKENATVSKEFPFAGFLEVDKGRAEIGGYRLHSETESGSGSAVVLVVEHAGQILRVKPEPGKNYKLWFTDGVLGVEAVNVYKTQPVGCQIRVTKRARPEAVPGCRMREEKFLTRDSIVLENGLIRVRIIPELGGRISELCLMPEDENQLKLDEPVRKVLSSPGAGGVSYEYGGLEEKDPGDWQGTFHQARFVPEVIEQTPKRLILRLTGKGLRVSGLPFDLQKEITLEDGKSTVGVELTLTNRGPAEKPLGLTIRPMLTVGGDCDAADVAYVPTEKGVNAYPYRSRITLSQIFPDQGWAGFVDQDRGVAYVTTFDLAKTGHAYLWMAAPGCKPDAYNLEVRTKDLATPPGGTVKFPFRYGLLRGLPAMNGVGETLAGGIVLPMTAEQGAKLEGRIVLSSFLAERRSYNLRLKLIGQGCKFSRELITVKVDVDHFNPASVAFTVETEGLKDGNYLLMADVVNAEHVVVTTLRQPLTFAGEKGRETQAVLMDFEKRLDAIRAKLAKRNGLTAEQRQGIVRGYMLLEELRTACEKRNAVKAGQLKVQLQTMLERTDTP